MVVLVSLGDELYNDTTLCNEEVYHMQDLTSVHCAGGRGVLSGTAIGRSSSMLYCILNSNDDMRMTYLCRLCRLCLLMYMHIQSNTHTLMIQAHTAMTTTIITT